MTDRKLVALGTALLLVGAACAQEPDALAPAVVLHQTATTAPAVVVHQSATPPKVWDNEPADDAPPDGQLWFSADYVLAWFSGDRLPPLVTTSPAGTSTAIAGMPGLSTTSTLFGENIVNDDFRSGFRLGGGYWFTPKKTLGIEAGFMTLESQSTNFDANSNGSLILARPYFDVVAGMPAASLIASPITATGGSAGGVAARVSSGEFYEAHIDLTENVIDTGWFRLDSLLGYRFYRYDEGVRISQFVTNNPFFQEGTVFASQDDFRTTNEFHGGDFGFRTQVNWQTLSLTLLTKIAVGMVDRDVNISGAQIVQVPGFAPVTRVGGFYAQPSNIGNYHRDDWTILPELGATLGWQVLPNVRVTAGYSVLWLDRIARAADQIDLGINPAFFSSSSPPATGPIRPTFTLIRNDAWLQSINIGAEIVF